MRETKKAGKRMPTDEEFEELNKEDFDRIMYTGYRDTYGSFSGLGTSEDFWSSRNIGVSAWLKSLSLFNSWVMCNAYDKDNGFSVRCIKE
jgi:uncharacterized protein (TIGR02145 family)